MGNCVRDWIWIRIAEIIAPRYGLRTLGIFNGNLSTVEIVRVEGKIALKKIQKKDGKSFIWEDENYFPIFRGSASLFGELAAFLILDTWVNNQKNTIICVLYTHTKVNQRAIIWRTADIIKLKAAGRVINWVRFVPVGVGEFRGCACDGNVELGTELKVAGIHALR